MAQTSVLLCIAKDEHMKLARDAFQGEDFIVRQELDALEIVDILERGRLEVAVVSDDALDGAWVSVAVAVRQSEKSKDAKVLLVQEADNLQVNDPEDLKLVDHVFPVPFSVGAIIEFVSEIRSAEAEKKWAKLNPNQQKLLRVTKNMFGKHFAPGGGDEKLSQEVMKESGNVIANATKDGEIWDILDTLKNHDNYTFVHAMKVSSFMTLFGVMLGIGGDDLETLAQAGLYHDIGKRETPLDVLNHPGKLEGANWDEMKRHAEISEDILRNSLDVPEGIVNVAGRHHEKLDGTGYPRGLRGAQIDDLSAICAIADVYSGLTDKRAYKPALSTEKTLEIMRSMSGTHLEANFLDRFVAMILEHENGKSAA